MYINIQLYSVYTYTYKFIVYIYTYVHTVFSDALNITYT